MIFLMFLSCSVCYAIDEIYCKNFFHLHFKQNVCIILRVGCATTNREREKEREKEREREREKEREREIN